jgi:hypothetical protein
MAKQQKLTDANFAKLAKQRVFHVAPSWPRFEVDDENL